MIEIKNKRMILFREDRLIGAKGDIETSKRKFVLDAVQGEYDLRGMLAWIKIDPKFPGESPYDQAIKKETVGDKIYLTWQFTAKNLQRAGEISMQIIFADPTYFVEDELDKIFGSSPFLPTPVEGISAPVWQTYPETFVIEESIDDTAGYKETTKNVLVSAVADALSSAERAEDAADKADESALSAQEAAQSAEKAAEAVMQSQEAVLSMKTDVENKAKAIEQDYHDIREAGQEILGNVEVCQECAELVDNIQHQTYNYMEAAQKSSKEAEQNAKDVLSTLKKASDFRLIYKKTLTAEDTDCYSFEVTEDVEGNPFFLSEFTLYAHVPTTPDINNVYVQIKLQPDNILENGERKYGIVAQFPGINSSKEYYYRVECANRGRWRANLIRGDLWSQNADSVYHNGGVCSSSRFADGKNATAIIFSSSYGMNKPFPESTEIEIWGVDSIKEAE